MTAELLLFLLALPFAFWASWQDLSRMKLPNKMNIAIAAVFIVLGAFLFPLDEYLFRIGVGFSVWIIMTFMSLLMPIGGGDIKYTAATLPWIPLELMPVFVFLLTGTILVGYALHRIARRIRCVRAMAPRWKSWRKRKYPLGISISSAWLLALGIAAFNLPFLAR